MKILVHAISAKMGGAKRHLNNMMKALAKSGHDFEWLVIVNDEFDTSAFESNVEIIRFPETYSSGWKRILLDNWHINKIIKEKKIDLLISFANFGPVKASCKHILFEMNALYFCTNIRNLYGRRQHIDFAIKRILIKLSAIWADLIITPSKSLKLQLIDTLNIPENKIDILYHASEKEFCRIGQTTNITKKENSTVTTFLYPSHLARHKGIHILLDALKIVKFEKNRLLPPFEVICTFAKSDEPEYYDELTKSIEQHDLDDIIRFVGFVPQEEINQLYASSDYMLYTTLCESFGFSMLEAKVFHLPALCSNIPINREISKEAALYYQWNDPEDLADKIEFIITQKPDQFNFNDELLEWHWENYAEKLIACMNDVLSR
ncbi:glycosyltransferase [Hydrogenimonas cancrithermarum]|uniref:Glycosyltransferase n=1 Tax=Hydrogenimonas cancrithermarum TaxID=2993563 RepID=A0ABM8FMB2_9BACT|nr:glycosyltransferase [Hydrogenimonas cancrithermarum]BDY13535.1 hypothetical protein HCR_18470 [Hydrogenimonas cancrithermarum]